MTTCLNEIDYSTVPAPRRVPFTFVLDEEESNLFPDVGENQRFCYRIAGVGSDVPTDADLSHFVLVACPSLTLEDIVSAQVVIDGIPREVNLGDNVTVQTVEHPDPTTGCSGIKVDFGLDKVDGEMLFCVTLRRAFAIGPVRVCVKGGQTVLSNLFICGPTCGGSAGCSTTVAQYTTVCVPVTVTPHAIVGEVSTQCCGDPVVTPGRAECLGNPVQSCEFTISQTMCLEIPVAFSANAVAGEAHTQCQEAVLGECACGESS